MRYGFAIDTKRCVGCHTCAVQCRYENNIPKETWWNRIMTDGGDHMDLASGQFPNVTMSYLPVACQHCDNPSCVKVCPVGATYKDEETGVVRQDYDKCIGCRMCIAACPFTGVRSFNWGEPAYAVDVTLGDAEVAPHQKHTVEKCTFCYQRTSQGESPACMEVCPPMCVRCCLSKARTFGDLDDPESEVSRLIASREYKQLLPEEGTKPSVYYLV